MSDINISLTFWLNNCSCAHLEGFNESPKQSANALPSTEELDQAHDSKQPEESDGDASAVLSVL